MNINDTRVYKWFSIRLSYSLLWILAFNPAISQNQTISFQSLQEGLPNPHIKCILKDSKGFMWFGTIDGLVRYDGTDFVLYDHNPSDSTSISHNNINAIIEDRNQKIWIATGHGLNLYDRENDNFTLIDAFSERDVFYVQTLFSDNNGVLWVGTLGNGLFSYNPESSNYISYTHTTNENSLASNFINAIIEDKDGNLWIGTRDGLDLLNKDKGEFRHFVNNPRKTNSISYNLIKDLALDSEGDLWIGTYGGGLNKLKKEDNDFSFDRFRTSDHSNSISHNNILSLASDEEGNLWIGTENGGLGFLNTKTMKFANHYAEDGNPRSLSNNSIWSLYYDNTDILWIGTSNSGICIYDRKFEKFKVIQKNPFEKNTLISNNVRAFAEDRKQNLWIGTDGGGLSYYNTITGKFENKFDNTVLRSKAVTTMALDNHNKLWVGTWPGGIDLINSQTGEKIKNYQIKNETGPINNVMKIFVDKSGGVWAGTFGRGLYKYQRHSDSFTLIVDKQNNTHLTKTAYISSMSEDDSGALWIGTLFGLIRIDRNENGNYSFSHFLPDSQPNSISSAKITFLYKDSNNNLWVGTEEGLNQFIKSDSTFISYDILDGLPNNNVNGILEDSNGNLWISTNGGISKFNSGDQTFYNFFKEDGLCSNVFNVGACLKTNSGNFFLGGNNGITTFYPDSLKMNKYIPPVYITGIKLFNNQSNNAENPAIAKNITETKSICLTYEQNSFSLEFAALNYTRPFKNQYACMLEGFESSWNYKGNRSFTTYTNLDPGEYTFKVKASNNDGLWNENPKTLEIVISPPLWKTVWAYITYFIILFLLLFSFIRLFRIKAHQAQKLKMERMNHEKDEELNNLKIQFFTNVSHELKTPLSLIMSPLEEAIAEKETKGKPVDNLKIALGNTEKMVRLVNELMDFTKSEGNRLKMIVQEGDLVKFAHEIFYLYTDEAKRKGISYQFITSANQIDAWFDKNKMEKIIHNLISNAFNHTPENGTIKVKIDTERNAGLPVNINENITISVIDNGCGISPQYLDRVFDRFFQSPETDAISQTGTGIGLALTKNLVELHHGKITVTSEKWKETCFKVKLPLGKAHYKDDEIFLGHADTGTPLFYAKKRDYHISKDCFDEKDTPLVLVVEDNLELRHYILSVLSQKFRTIEASDGEEGFQVASSELPDLILSDIIMPKMNGLDLCKKVKEERSTSHIPVILLTSKTTTFDKIEGVESGADSYITKPFNIQHLEATIHKIIETRKKLFKQFSQDVYILPKEISSNKSDQEFLEKIVEYIDDNVMNVEITVENLASYLKMNRSNVYRKVKSLTGQTATGFIRSVRLKMALKYIEEGEYNISEIAFKVGFESPWYFAKCFKKQFGKSPSEYLPEEKTK